MPETKDPFADFDLQVFFRLVDKKGLKGALAEQQPILLESSSQSTRPQVAEENPQFKNNLSRFQIRILTDYFNGRRFTSVPEMARQFKSAFDNKKQQTLNDKSVDPTERRFYNETTMQTLAQTALKLLDNERRKKALAYPGSEDYMIAGMNFHILKTITDVVELASTF